MQNDSLQFSTSGQFQQVNNQALTQESPGRSFQCCHCTLIFVSKAYLFEHLNKVHNLDVDAALRDAGLKFAGASNASTDNNGSSSGDHFKACSWDVLNEHDEQCQKNLENPDLSGPLKISVNPDTKITAISTKQHNEAAGAEEIPSVVSVMSTSKAKCTLNSSTDLKTYKRPFQTIPEYFAAASGSNGNPSAKLADSTKGTLILQESPSTSSPNSSGVFKVTAKSVIDITNCAPHCFLQNDHLLVPELRPPKPSSGSSESRPAKKFKSGKEETKLPEKESTNKEQSSSNAEFSFDVSEDEEEKTGHLVNGDTESAKVYFCKHCDYSDVALRRVSTHYQKDHPYVRYKAVYIQDSRDQSATFRCLECPVEFLSTAELKRHYMENHPGAPDIFTMKSHELNLVFKCFVCPFTTNILKALEEHYKEKHPRHEVDSSLLYYRYSVTGCEKESSQLNKCEKMPSPETSRGTSPESAPCEEATDTASPQHVASKAADVALYKCNNCKFSHKSFVVMHVHYQKCHPDEAVTIDKLKQSAQVTSNATLQMTPEKSPNSVTVMENSAPLKNISDSSKKTKDNAELSQKKKMSLSLKYSKHTPETSKNLSESPKTKKVESVEEKSKTMKSPTKRSREMATGMENLSSSSSSEIYYCQFCSYTSNIVKGVVGHHNAKHARHALISIDEVIWYSEEVREKKLLSQLKASQSAPSSHSKTREQAEVCCETEVHCEEDDAVDASMTEAHAYADPEKLFYCQKCNFGNPTVKGVINHQAKLHRRIDSNRECVIDYTTLIRDEIKKSKTHAKGSPSWNHLPLPLMNEGDENSFFCPYCNYRHSTINQVLRHCSKTHHGSGDRATQIQQYTSVVLKKTHKEHLRTTGNQEVNQQSLGKIENKKTKTKTFTKSATVSASPSRRASQALRDLRCYRCSYSAPHVYLLKRHIWKCHRAKRPVTAVLRVCFRQGELQEGYHCEFCVFSHENAATLYKHYQEQHPERKRSPEYVRTRLYVGPTPFPSEKKKPKLKCTDGSFPSRKSGQNKTKMYSCSVCSFEGSSMSSIAQHYHAVHPSSAKADGLDLHGNKKARANNQMEDLDEMPGLFETFQVPLEVDNLPNKATASSTVFECPHCPASFVTQHGVSVHCGMKHPEYLTENLKEPQKQQTQTQTRVHVFKCPHCTYVNTVYQGVLTHCQMKHPALVSRADSLHVDMTYIQNWEEHLNRNGPGDTLKVSGHMCKTCPQICATLDKLNKHCEMDHNKTVSSTVPRTLKPVPQPPAVSPIQQSQAHGDQGSVSKASSLSKKVSGGIRCQQCSYFCTTKIAFSRHLRVHHKNVVSKDCVYKCILCSKAYFWKKHLAGHYFKKHGKDSYLKYYVPVYKKGPKKPEPTSPDNTLTPQPQNTSESCKSDMTAEENNILVYRCPSCPYVNASYHGTLTHCQMKHPTVVARADELETCEINSTNMVRCTMGKGSNERGYMCKKCPQIHVSLTKLKIHSHRNHKRTAVSEHSPETENQSVHDSQVSAPEAVSSRNETSEVSITETEHSSKSGTPETWQSNSLSVQNKGPSYKCQLCTYTGWYRRYLQSHYKNLHKLDPLSIHKLLEKYNKRKLNKPSSLSDERASVKCKMCPNLTFDSSQILIDHYNTFHRSACKTDFAVLSLGKKKNSTGIYKCTHCMTVLYGIRKLCRHLDRHEARKKEKAKAAKRRTLLDFPTTPDPKSVPPDSQEGLLTFETVEDHVTPADTFVLPASPLQSPSKLADADHAAPESKDGHTCKQCGRTFMSLKGLRSHERSHAALAALKKLNHLPNDVKNINKYVLHKSGTTKPFLCTFCSYRTPVLGLWRRHFMRKHRDVLLDPTEADDEDESAQRADIESPNSSDKINDSSELDEEPERTEKSLYLEPPDVQRQLNHYNLMAQSSTKSKVSVQESKLPENNLFDCDLCNFSSGHLSSIRRHYINRHGKKLLRCKDCSFFTASRKTLEMHMETGHSTCQAEPTHQKDLRCPFCLYQTKNKNSMIDHIVLHREERVVPIEVRRPKLSRYLQGVVFRCHKCTFSSGSAENLRLHMTRHDDIKPYKCRLCYFDCPRLSDLEAHLSDKHQVVRNHELVGQVSLDQLEAKVGGMTEKEDEPLPSLEQHNNDSEDVETEEFDMDCNEGPQAEDEVENDTREVLQISEAHQKQGQDVNEESPAERFVSDVQGETAKPTKQAGIVVLPEPAGGRGIENVKPNIGTGNSARIQLEDCNDSVEARQTNEKRAHPKLGNSEDGSTAVTQQKEKAAEGSSTAYFKPAEKRQAHKLLIKAHEQRRLDIEARLEDDILRHVLLLDEDNSICKKHKQAGQDSTVKTEQKFEDKGVDSDLSDIPVLDDEGSITVGQTPKNQVNTQAIPALAKMNLSQANNIRIQDSFTIPRHLLTPDCAPLKSTHPDSLGVSFANCKQEQVDVQKNCEEAPEPYGEMPVLENVYLKEEMQPLGCCKEEEDDYHLEQQKQDKDVEMIVEGDRCKDQDSLHVQKGAFTATEGAAEVLCSSLPEDKQYVCELCGRNLMNSSELKRHVMRHGI